MREEGYLWQADGAAGGGGTDSPAGGDDAVSKTFGGLERSARPDLAFKENRYREAQKTERAKQTPPPTITPRATEPKPERAAEAPPAKETKPAPEGPTGEEPEDEGWEDEAPEADDTQAEMRKAEEADRTPDELRKIIEAFQTPEKLASAVKGLRQLQFKTREQAKASEARLRDLTPRIEQLESLEAAASKLLVRNPDGEWDIRPAAAARVLQAQNGQANGDVSEETVRRAVEREWRKELASDYEGDDLDQVLQRFRGRIDQDVKSRVESMKSAREANNQRQNMQIAGILREHFEQNPTDKDLLPKVAQMMETLPEAVQREMALNGWLGGIPKLFYWTRLETRFEDAAKQIWKAALDWREKNVEPDSGAAPRGGRKTPSRRGAKPTEDQAYKDAILGAGRKGTLGQLFGSR